MHDTGLAANADNVAALVDAWTLMVGRFTGHDIAAGDGFATIIGNVPLAFYNFIVLDRPVSDLATLDHVLAAARHRAEACAHPAMLAACTEWLPAGWADNFAVHGLADPINMTGMASDQLLPPRRPAPAELVLRRVEDVAAASAVARINAHAYGMPEAEVAFMYAMDLWQPRDSFGVVGSVDGRDVTCTAAFVLPDMIYIALVATEPDVHGRGYAEAAMRHAIALAVATCGDKRIWLHASDMGRPVYAAMGFTAGATTPAYGFA